MAISEITALRAFKSQNYLYYFLGRSITQFGTWMQRTAVIWIIYTLTHSPFMLGVTVFAEQFPSFLFSFLGGVAADRYDRSKIIRITQVAAVIQTVLLAIFLLSGRLIVWEILGLSVLLGIINAFDVPARQTLIHEVVQSEQDLPSALSLNSAMSSVSKILGPAAAGFALEHFNIGWSFVFIAIAFVVVILLFSKIKIAEKAPASSGKSILGGFKEGINYVRNTKDIGLVILMLSIIGLLVLPYDTLLSEFAKVTFKGGAATFGYISGFIGLGAVAGTIFLASIKNNKKLRYYLIISTVLLGVGLISFAATTNLYLALVFAIITGFGTVMQFTCSNIIVQSEAEPLMRGRAISILLTAIFGMVPIGSLLTGFVSQHLGNNRTLILQGILALIIAVVFSKAFKKNRSQDSRLKI